MLNFALRRLFYSLILVLITLTIIFFVTKLSPGDPLNRYYSPDADPELVPRVRHQFGLDRPLPEQYVRWIWNFVRGDFGLSLSEDRPVAEILKETIPRTLQLTVLAMAIEIILGLGFGVLMAAKRNSGIERALMLLFLFFYSLPTFYFAYILIGILSIKLQWLPAASMFSVGGTAHGFLEVLKDRAAHLVMPVFVLAFGSAAGLARFTRGSIIDVIGREFIRTARAKGLSEFRIIWVHTFKNALAPLLTVIGLSFPFLLGGSVVVEKVFSWPGMGALTVDAIFARDYPVILAACFIAACMVIAGNFLADISYCAVNPRIKLARCQEDKTA